MKIKKADVDEVMSVLCSGQVWSKEYERALKNRPKNVWIPHMMEKLGAIEQEISIVHTSDPHGLISWGWGGNKKIILPDQMYQEELPLAARKALQSTVFKAAEAIAEALNKSSPNGLWSE